MAVVPVVGKPRDLALPFRSADQSRHSADQSRPYVSQMHRVGRMCIIHAHTMMPIDQVNSSASRVSSGKARGPRLSTNSGSVTSVHTESPQPYVAASLAREGQSSARPISRLLKSRGDASRVSRPASGDTRAGVGRSDVADASHDDQK